MHAQDFVAMYFDWLRETVRVLMGRPDVIAPKKSIIADYLASEEQRKRESDPRVVLSFLGAVASTDPELAAAIQACFFQWLLEKKVLKPIDPRVVRRRGRPRSAKPKGPLPEPGRPGAPRKWTPEARMNLARLVDDVKKHETADADGARIRSDAKAIEWLLVDHAKRKGGKRPNAYALHQTVKTWANELSKLRRSLPTTQE